MKDQDKTKEQLLDEIVELRQRGAGASGHDVTDRKPIERALAEGRQAAEVASTAKREFLENMGHELYAPLTAILGFSEILRGGMAKQEAIQACEIIQHNGEHLLGVINDILDLSKIEAGRLVLNWQTCSPRQIVSEVMATMTVRADVKGLRLSFEHQENLPEKIQTDPRRLRQILVNLIGHAIKFTEAGSVRVLVSSETASSEGGKLRFEVIDTGKGIAQEGLVAIFQPFSQVHSPTHHSCGCAGLGLAISQRLARMLGGDIKVASTQGKGTTFSATVAMGPPDEAKPVPSSPEATEKPAAVKSEPVTLDCRILLVEDGPNNQRLTALVLGKTGAEVVTVGNGQQAVELAFREGPADRPFDLILMDMEMPVMDGYEATSNLRKKGYRKPILALTAHQKEEDRQKCLAAGCDDYLAKPWDRKSLVQLVSKYVKSKPRSQESQDPASPSPGHSP